MLSEELLYWCHQHATYRIAKPKTFVSVQNHNYRYFHLGTGEKCGRPPTIENGDITTLSLHEYAFGSSVEYRCQHYYIIEGERKSYCYNGIWTKEPVCLEPCVITQEDMRSHNIDLKWASAQKLYVSHGDFVEFKCRSSLLPNSSNNYRVQCNVGQIPYPQCT
ncbi:Complement factor H-related protein 2 [Chelonia mydas]|uniref:Complement factor H-related protein 2 n=1 Tax=Chelonia mydas TaxID=8469 RepID=M7B2T7_CHEMY|nr:Complement factor H-related protein 2 [Chelonia mydas]